MTAEDMKQDATVTINWFRVNLPTIAMIIGAVWFMAEQNSTLKQQNVLITTRLEAMEVDRQERSQIADRNYAAINTTLEIMRGQNIPYRVGQAEALISETRQRLDQLQQTLLGQIDLVRKDLARLTTQFEVMNTRVGILTGDLDERGKSISRQRPAVN